MKAPKALARCTQEGERITERITYTVAQADCSNSTGVEILAFLARLRDCSDCFIDIIVTF